MTVQILIPLLMTWVFKPLLLMSLLLIVVVLLRKKSASLQHFVLALGMMALLVQPVLNLIVPIVSWHLLSLDGLLLSGWVGAWLELLLAQITKTHLLTALGLYIFIASWLVFYFLLGVIGLYGQTRRGTAVNQPEFLKLTRDLSDLLDISRPVYLVTSAEVSAPQMWGLLRPVIMLPREALSWEDDKKLTIMIHELGHVRRCDWLITMAVKFSCALFWFLPPVWWFARRLYQQAEIACDDFIYRLRDKHLFYAETLMAFAGLENTESSATPVPKGDSIALSMLGHSALYKRIFAVLDKRRPRQVVAMEAVQYWFLCSLFICVPLASLQLLPIQQVLAQRLSEFELGVWQPPPQPTVIVRGGALTPAVNWRNLKQSSMVIDQLIRWESELQKLTHDSPLALELDRETSIDIESITPLWSSGLSIEASASIRVISPEYPEFALQRGQEGWVQVEFAIDAAGFVRSPKIVGQSPARVFEKSVLTALLQSRYSPLVINGQAVALQGVAKKYTFKIARASDSSRRR